MSFTYDSLSLLNSQTRTINGEEFTTSYPSYDDLNRPEMMTYPNGKTVTITFDQMGANSLVESGSPDVTLVSGINHDINGQLSLIDRPGSLVDTVYGYDINGRLKHLHHGTKHDSIPYYDYVYHPDGNISRIFEYVNGDHEYTNFEYDHLDRLTRAYTGTSDSIPGLVNYDRHFDYDELGNLTSRTGSGGTVDYDYPGPPQHGCPPPCDYRGY